MTMFIFIKYVDDTQLAILINNSSDQHHFVYVLETNACLVVCEKTSTSISFRVPLGAVNPFLYAHTFYICFCRSVYISYWTYLCFIQGLLDYDGPRANLALIAFILSVKLEIQTIYLIYHFFIIESPKGVSFIYLVV